MASSEDVTVMYRPVGPEELELLRQADFKRWPPRLAFCLALAVSGLAKVAINFLRT